MPVATHDDLTPSIQVGSTLFAKRLDFARRGPGLAIEQPGADSRPEFCSDVEEPLDVRRLGAATGIAELEDDDGAATVFRRADATLYRAKELGKGQVTTAQAEA